jgi:hypothetical protein
MDLFCAAYTPFSGHSKLRMIFEWEKSSFQMHRGSGLRTSRQIQYLETWSGCKNVSILATESLSEEELVWQVQSCEMAAQPQTDAGAESLSAETSRQILAERCAWPKGRLGVSRYTAEGGVLEGVGEASSVKLQLLWG